MWLTATHRSGQVGATHNRTHSLGKRQERRKRLIRIEIGWLVENTAVDKMGGFRQNLMPASIVIGHVRITVFPL
jgi:hypothetical protein